MREIELHWREFSTQPPDSVHCANLSRHRGSKSGTLCYIDTTKPKKIRTLCYPKPGDFPCFVLLPNQNFLPVGLQNTKHKPQCKRQIVYSSPSVILQVQVQVQVEVQLQLQVESKSKSKSRASASATSLATPLAISATAKRRWKSATMNHFSCAKRRWKSAIMNHFPVPSADGSRRR